MQPSPQVLKPKAEDYAFSRLIAYAALQFPRYQTAAHHRLIARKLEAVERGEIKRLMISMPPRHGKSMLASEFFPAWYLGRNPDRYVIAASYGQELAEDFGRKVRNQIADATFQAVFPQCKLMEDSTGAKRFNTNKGGSYFALGVGGAITGRGAHLLLIDDPVKNREEAESELMRRKVWDWYTSTAYTRLMPDAAVVVIQTRWHEDDLSGKILKEHAHEGWEVLKLPAVTDGQALWQEQYSLETLDNIRRTIGTRDWSALYQQEPAPDEGDYFKREWIRWYDPEKLPTHLAFYGASDYAVTSKGGDYTCHLVGGIDPAGNLYIPEEGYWRGQSDSLEWVDSLIALIKHFKPVAWAEETGQIRSALDPLITKRQREERAYCYREVFPTRGDKAVRAQTIRGRMAQGMVYLPKGAQWVDDFVSELLHFPAGKNDDQVDAFGLLGQLLDKMVKAKPESDKPKPKFLEEATFNEIFWQETGKASDRI
jgi:predicted phage terminase large subunit-like protein